MSDIVERLRECPHKPCPRCNEAADEIERLRERERDALRAELATLRERLEKVEALHPSNRTLNYCETCFDVWPCQIVRAARGEDGK